MIIDSKRNNIIRSSAESVAEFRKRKSEGYYTDEKKEERKTQAERDAKKALIKEYETECAKVCKKARTERDVKLWLLSKGMTKEQMGNIIYYNHSNELGFNWQSYGYQFTEKAFTDFCDSIDRNDFDKLPSDIVFELKGVKKYSISNL